MDRDGRLEDTGRGRGSNGTGCSGLNGSGRWGWKDGLQAPFGGRPMAAYSGNVVSVYKRSPGIPRPDALSGPGPGIPELRGRWGHHLAAGAVRGSGRLAGSGPGATGGFSPRPCAVAGGRPAFIVAGQRHAIHPGRGPFVEGFAGSRLLTQADAEPPAGQVIRRHHAEPPEPARWRQNPDAIWFSFINRRRT